jgi:predicted GNAT superfamily acetyltransferase
MESEFSIRGLGTIGEARQVEELQRSIWPGSDLEIVPSHLLLTIATNGGILLGAFDGERLVGFVLGFLGVDPQTPDRVAMARLKHCSHMLGVLPDYRDSGIGFQLKCAQRAAALQQGLRLITWTYDPLISRNAHLNFRRLGVVCSLYHRDHYGEMRDGLNIGVPSDRFEVEWWVTSPRVRARLAGRRKALELAKFIKAGALHLNPPAAGLNGFPRPRQKVAAPAGTLLMVEIPPDFTALKEKDPALALAWRLQSREIFEEVFRLGYLVVDFIFAKEEGRSRSLYMLSHGEATLG